MLGATGILGRRVVPQLLARGHAVTAAGRDEARLARLGTSFVAFDILNRESVMRAVRGHDVVINLTTSVPGTGPRALFSSAWRDMDRVRRDGSAHVAEAVIAHGVGRLLQESFGLTYPDCGARWIDENVTPRPAAYNRTALDAEDSARRVTTMGGVGVALRFALLYGGVEDGFTRDTLRYAQWGWLPLLGRPDGYVAMVTHDDAARAVVAAVDAPPGIYNVVDDDPMTRADLSRLLGDVLGVRPPRLAPGWATKLGPVAETIGRSLRLSNRVLREATDWRPRYSSGREGWRAAADAILTVNAQEGPATGPA